MSPISSVFATVQRRWCRSEIFAMGIAAASCLLAVSVAVQLRAEESASASGDEPVWISSIAWKGDAELVGTRSQGLLLRPADVVAADVGQQGMLGDWKVVGSAAHSLWSLVVLPDGRLVAADYKGQVAVYGDGDPQSFQCDLRWVRKLALAPGGDQILAGTEDGKVALLSVADLKQTSVIEVQNSAVFDIAFDPAGEKVAVASGDGSITVHAWPTLERVQTMQADAGAVWAVAFSYDGSQLISGGADRAVRLWDVARGEKIVALAETSDWITSLVVLPETHLVACGSMGGDVTVVDYGTMRRVTSEKITDSAIWALALSPDQSRLAVATRKSGAVVVPLMPWREAGLLAEKEVAKLRAPAP